MTGTLGCFAAAIFLAAGRTVGGFEFQVVGVETFSETQQTAFAQAKKVWTDVIVGYAAGIENDALQVQVSSAEIDGVGGIIGLASIDSTVTEGGFTIVTEGSFELDSADLVNLENDGFLVTAIAHEFGHLVGVGTQWEANAVYVAGSGEYSALHGLAAYRREFDADATFIPVELGGGELSSDSHWDEISTVFDAKGRPFAFDLMTGFLSAQNYLTWTTIQSLRDIGYAVIDYPLEGDYNHDGIVDALDFVTWRDTLGSNLADADGDLDGMVDDDDYLIWKGAFGNSQPAELPSAVPEPGGMVPRFGLLGSLLVWAVRARRHKDSPQVN